MMAIAFKRLSNRIWLTLLSIMGVTLAVGLVVGIPVFAKAMSFVMLREELNWLAETVRYPPFSLRVYVTPSSENALSLKEIGAWSDRFREAIEAESGLSTISQNRQMETVGLLVRTRDEVTRQGPPNTTVYQDTRVTIAPGIGSKMTILDGEPLDARASSETDLDIWIHYTAAEQAGFFSGDKYQLYDARRRVAVPIRIAGIWTETDRLDPFWFQNSDRKLQKALLVREDDYQNTLEPIFERQLRLISWYLLLDHGQLTPTNMREHADGLRTGQKLVWQYLPDLEIDSPLLEALDIALKRESDLTILMFVLGVPVMGSLLYFLSLISTITARWQQRETAIMASRGLRRGQLLIVNIVESTVIIGLGLPLGVLAGTQLARVMGYTASFMQFTWRAPLPVSPTALNVPLLVAALSALLLARLWPVLRSTRTSVVMHEQRRARAPQRPFWQRAYIDFLLLIPVVYAYRRLSDVGTLVPQVMTGETPTTRDPLLFLVPALFTLALSLLLVRLFPVLMRIGDGLSALGRQTAPYLAFRQLARQSSQYTSALLLVITSLSLGGFMASLAASLNNWVQDQVYYAVGADVFIKQMYNPVYLMEAMIPSDGAWMMPVESYLQVPGVTRAARVGMYRSTIYLSSYDSLKATFLGVDRLDVPSVLFFRPDFANESLGGLTNLLASREDAVLLSERIMEMGQFEVGDKVPVKVVLVDLFDTEVSLKTDFTIVGSYKYFPTVYEQNQEQTGIIGNLDFVFSQIGGPELHDTWLKIAPDADKDELVANVEAMKVFIQDWVEAREEIAQERASAENVGVFGTLTLGFLAAAAFSGIGLLIYNYASLQERLFRFTILRAVGLSLWQVVSQVTIEYIVLMIYGVAGGAAIGAWASKLFIPFFQAADENVLCPPTLIPIIAWDDIGRISGAFVVVLIMAQIAVIAAVLRKGVFQALRMGDLE
jgi:putative ABC transport system permease protein